ncbi:hypothetical protein PIROE2DRAFT_11067 [Piromyces sp. E2]|nr:hypothetical protein PIROE2DRAFT_11067 [Piromyces sp. E2]|eukprot:OUM62588.1 hypothetical protein PIROE2DRAFT_11067 [Piromyces sp. E2]
MVLTEQSRSYSINISIPSQNECKKLTVSEHDLIQGIKEKIIRDITSPEGNDNLTNNGILLVSKKKDLKQFLNDKDEIGDLKKLASDFSLEFVPKYKIPTKEEEKKNASMSNDTEVQKKFIDMINEDNNDNQIRDILEMGVDPNFVTDNGGLY